MRFILTGGIGSGKSAAATIFGRLGAEVISADEAARATIAPDGEAYAAAAARWPEVVQDAAIDRMALASIVFSDPEQRLELEAMTHPPTVARVAAQVAAAAGPVVVEVPLPGLFDSIGPGWPVVVVDAPEETRMVRVQARGLPPETIEGIMAVQPTRGEWLALADYVIDNAGTFDGLETECRTLWTRLTAEH